MTDKPLPMSVAPRDGTRVLAWWPELPDGTENYGWVTTWWGKSYGGQEEGWECPWEWERPEAKWGPTHWLPHPKAPGDA